MRALVPLAVLLLTAAAAHSAWRPGASDARAEPLLAAAQVSARGLWTDAAGNTVLVAERIPALGLNGAVPTVELRFLDPRGRTAWVLPLGSGVVSALVDAQDVLYLALIDSATGSRSQLMALEMESGELRWQLEVDGEVTDLLADGSGGLRARSLRQQDLAASEEHLLSVRDGELLWDVALAD